MQPRLRLAVAVSLALLSLTATAAPDDARLPVPDPAARAAAVAVVRKDLKDAYKPKEPDAKRKLARTLLDRAAAAKDDPAARYACLDEAANAAEEARDTSLAVEVAHALGAAFQVNGTAAAIASVDTITKSAKDPAALADGANAFVSLAGEALAAGDPSAAATALGNARRTAGAAKLPGLTARANELLECVASYRRLATASDAAAAALAAAPDDPAAAEATGRLLAFGRGDFAAGLPHLAKAPESPLRTAAAREAAGAAEAADKAAVADLWWTAAQKEKDPLCRARMLARAASLLEAEGEAIPADRRAENRRRLDTITFAAWDRTVAFTKDFSKSGAAQLGLATIRAFIAEQHVDKSSTEWRGRVPRFPAVTFDRGVEYVWTVDTNLGSISVRLFTDTAPLHAANFIYLTELGFYDGLAFHRVIPGFMAQSGATNANGTGGPGYNFGGEIGGPHKHDRAGVLSMANTGEPNSDNSQFFLTFAAAAHLDGKHAVFGEVVSGLDVLKKIETVGSPEGPTKSPVTITTARVSAR